MSRHDAQRLFNVGWKEGTFHYSSDFFLSFNKILIKCILKFLTFEPLSFSSKRLHFYPLTFSVMLYHWIMDLVDICWVWPNNHIMFHLSIFKSALGSTISSVLGTTRHVAGLLCIQTPNMSFCTIYILQTLSYST